MHLPGYVPFQLGKLTPSLIGWTPLPHISHTCFVATHICVICLISCARWTILVDELTVVCKTRIYVKQKVKVEQQGEEKEWICNAYMTFLPYF